MEMTPITRHKAAVPGDAGGAGVNGDDSRAAQSATQRHSHPAAGIVRQVDPARGGKARSTRLIQIAGIAM